MKRTKPVILFILILTFLFQACCQAAGVDDDVTKRACLFGTVKVEGTSPVVHTAIRKKYGTTNLSQYGLDGQLDYVHGMWYIAKVTKSMTASSADSDPNPVHVKKGEQVVIIKYLSKKGNIIARLKNKRSVYIPAKKTKVLYYLYNSTSRYKDVQIEEYVKQYGIDSKTQYMFFVSKFNQHGWVLQRVNGEWRCKYNLGVSTGCYHNSGKPNDIYGMHSLEIATHYKNKKNVGGNGKGMSYASKEGGNQIHTGIMYKPYTHGCIATSTKNWSFLYYYLPLQTRVVLI